MAEVNANVGEQATAKASRMDVKAEDPQGQGLVDQLARETLNEMNNMDPKKFRELISKTMINDKEGSGLDVKGIKLNEKGEIEELSFNNPFSKNPNERITLAKGADKPKATAISDLCSWATTDSPKDSVSDSVQKGVLIRTWCRDENKQILDRQLVLNDSKGASPAPAPAKEQANPARIA